MDRAKAEILRYLGRREQDVPEDLSALIDECAKAMRECAKPRHVIREFALNAGTSGIGIAGTELVLGGGDIARLLSGCERVFLLAATLGAEADRLIRRWERADLTRSLILDACATQLIEEVCDELENRISLEASAAGLAATRRFSPGYGDLPLEIQPRMLSVLDSERKIGLTCTATMLLLPRKSVTAVVGIVKTPTEKLSSRCGGCAMRGTCVYGRNESNNGCP